ncbi:MAG: SMC-Scp complex subunit ScpB [Planctomycetota bacterium]
MSDTDVAVDEAVIGAKVEAALLAMGRPLTSGRLAELLGLESTAPVKQAIEGLNAAYEETGRAFRIEAVAGGWQVMTLAEHADVVGALQAKKGDGKLSAAALETLAVVAYKQPILRADLEAIRGVACGEVLRALMERHLVKIVGRAEELGRPMLYGTTKRFLEVFGLATLKDLPSVEELAAPPTPSAPPAPPTEDGGAA